MSLYKAIQIISFSLVIAAVIFLYQLRTDLFSSWAEDLPANTPNYFAFNLAATDISLFEKILPNTTLYPMIRGRLIELNHKPIFSAVPVSAQDNNALHRELNLSYMWTLPSDNKIVNGDFWNNTDKNKPYISIEKNLADDLGIKLNDQLTFQVGDQQITGIVKNFRTLNWNSFHPNFYIIFPPGILDNFPTTYMTSFYLSSDNNFKLNTLTQTFPNITLIDASSVVHQVKLFLTQATLALQYAFILALAAAILLLIATLKSTLKARIYAYQLMRIIGASRNYFLKKLWQEFGLIGFWAGSLGIIFSLGISWSIMHFWLKMIYHFSPLILLWGYGLAFVFLTVPAVLFTRRILNYPPLLSSSTSLSNPKAV